MKHLISQPLEFLLFLVFAYYLLVSLYLLVVEEHKPKTKKQFLLHLIPLSLPIIIIYWMIYEIVKYYISLK